VSSHGRLTSPQQHRSNLRRRPAFTATRQTHSPSGHCGNNVSSGLNPMSVSVRVTATQWAASRFKISIKLTVHNTAIKFACETRSRTLCHRNGRDPITASAERISLNSNSRVGVTMHRIRTAGPRRTPQSKSERRTKWTTALPVDVRCRCPGHMRPDKRNFGTGGASYQCHGKTSRPAHTTIL
jgi:hypothetical protein